MCERLRKIKKALKSIPLLTGYDAEADPAIADLQWAVAEIDRLKDRLKEVKS